nr:uncharacterized protein LOC112704987 [Arachis hypogaea]
MTVVFGKHGDSTPPRVIFSEKARSSLTEPYMNTVVIKVLGKHFSYTALLHKLKGVWRLKYSFDELLDVGFEYFMIKLDLFKDRKRVLLSGGGNDVHSSGSRKPIKVDLTTKSVERSKFARACNQIDLGMVVIKKIIVDDYEYEVEYESLHLICGTCSCYGHVAKECKSASSSINEGVEVTTLNENHGKESPEIDKLPEMKNVTGDKKTTSFEFENNNGEEQKNREGSDSLETISYANHITLATSDEEEGGPR